MSSSPPPKDPTGRQALLSAYKEVVESEKMRKQRQNSGESKTRSRLVLLTVVTVILGVALVEHAKWLDPVKMPEESRPIREASLRLVMARQIHGIESWRQAHGGALPDSASAARTTLSPFRYDVANGQYKLTGSNGDITLTYESSESLSTFLGNSYEVVRNRGKQ